MKLTDKQSGKIQILRGVAIIAVVFIHNTPSGITQVFCRPFLNFSVGLFLFLSGMLSDVDCWNPQKRILKVVFPYILWTAIYVVFNNYKTLELVPVSFMKNLITGKAAAIMYYIFVYCEFTLLMPLIDKLAKSKYKYLGFVITPVEIICMRLMPLIMDYEINKYIIIIRSLSCLGWFTFYYFGYLVGNNIIHIKCTNSKLICMWLVAMLLQIFEGYWYWSMNEANCGTQLKLTSVLTGIIFATMAYKFVNSDKVYNLKVLQLIGDNSFGIYFSHLAVMLVLGQVPFYSTYVWYPINAIIAVIVSLFCVLVGKKVLGKYGKYLGL